MNKQLIIDYISHTPENVNTNYVGSMIDKYTNEIASIVKVNNSKVTDYLYEITYNKYDYAEGERYLRKYSHQLGACSGVKKDDFVGRNYDWNYDNSAEFIVRTTAAAGRHASIGVASASIHNDIANSQKYIDSYKILPFMMLDGINDAGVYISENVVPDDKCKTTGTNPGHTRLCGLMVPRLVLDKADNAKHALEVLKQYDIYAPSSIGYDVHFLIADRDNSYIVEFVNNQLSILSDNDLDYPLMPNGKPILTNFFLSGWNGDVRAVPLGDTPELTKATGLQPHAEGLERYLILDSHYNNINDKATMMQAMDDVKYTKMYDPSIEKPWYTESVGVYKHFGDITIYSTKEEYQPILELEQEMFIRRDRNHPETWQTVHSVVYDLANKSLTVKVQEENTEYSYNL